MELNEILSMTAEDARNFLLSYPNEEFPVYSPESVNLDSDIDGLREEVAAIHGYLIGAYTV